MEKDIFLEVDEFGVVREKVEPYASIVIDTEESFNEFNNLLNIGKAVKEAYKQGYILVDFEEANKYIEYKSSLKTLQDVVTTFLQDNTSRKDEEDKNNRV